MFKPKKTKANGNMIYRTLYIREELIKELETYANASNTSLNSMIVQMIEYCLEELKNSEE